jgi:hypothetical protein
MITCCISKRVTGQREQATYFPVSRCGWSRLAIELSVADSLLALVDSATSPPSSG